MEQRGPPGSFTLLHPLLFPLPFSLFTMTDRLTTARSYASLSSFLLLFLLHLACFFLRSRDGDDRTLKRKITTSSSLTPNPSKFISLRSYLRRFLCFRDNHEQQEEAPPPSDSTPIQLIALSPDARTNGKVNAYVAVSADVAIYPCASCGEVKNKAQLLDLHQATMHSLSELFPSDSGHNIVRIIFESGWRGTSSVIVRRVLKIHHTARALARYEEYRDAVRARAARKGCDVDGRCIADGNERLRFYCTTTLCSWDARATGGVCRNPFCCSCAVVSHGFTRKHADLDGIATHATSWGAHAALPEELEREFAFLGARRAMLVCRVVAGRVQRRGVVEANDLEKGAGFDSAAVAAAVGGGDEVLAVFSPRAVLPCFVVSYSA